MDDRLFLCALHRISFLSAKEKSLFCDMFSRGEELTRLSLSGVESIICRRLRKPNWDAEMLLEAARRDVAYCASASVQIVCIRDDTYPVCLREIYDPPFLLFIRGKLADHGTSLAAVVGTRKPTGKALKAAYGLCLELGKARIPVVSGLARGIDAAAHRGCMDAGCASYAVLGTGIDEIYPKENRDLARKMIEKGAILSEYPPGTPALAYNFPNRNRIISGLASLVVIAQAPKRSGALITADYALDQGRDVVVLQEGLDGVEGEGTQALARDGAVVVTATGVLLSGPNAEHQPGMSWPAASSSSPKQDATGIVMAKNLEDELCGSARIRFGEYFRSG